MRDVTRPPDGPCRVVAAQVVDTPSGAVLTVSLAAAVFVLLAAFGAHVSWTPVLLALCGTSFVSLTMLPLLADDTTLYGRVLACGVLPCAFAAAIPLTDVLSAVLGFSLW